METKKTYAVFTWRVANALYARGFKPVGKRLNYKDPTQEVILFEDSLELRQAIKEINKK